MLFAKAVARRASYEWQVSTDQKTRTLLPVTLQSKTTVSALTPGTTYYFRARPVTNVATGDVGSHYHRNHRYPGSHPLARGRFFAISYRAARRTWQRRSGRWRCGVRFLSAEVRGGDQAWAVR